jgi:hypothetical protein
MTRPTWWRIAARAWDIGPTWKDAAALAIVAFALMWFGTPWWAALTAVVVGAVAVFGALGWLELLNEAAEGDQAEEPPPGGGD